MQLEKTIFFDQTPAAVRAQIDQFFTARGYRAAGGPGEIQYRRGSKWGSLTSFTPKGWLCVISINLRTEGTEASWMQATYQIDTSGQMVTQKEREFWQAEIRQLEETIRSGRVILADEGKSNIALNENVAMAGIILLISAVFAFAASILFKTTDAARYGLIAGLAVSIVVARQLLKVK